MFITIHMLTAYPPSNPNRGEDGSPKTAIVGGRLRGRMSSQSIKRAWRLSPVMRALNARFSTRSRTVWQPMIDSLVAGGIKDKEATAYVLTMLECFGKRNTKKMDKIETSEMVVFGFEEIDRLNDVIKALIGENTTTEAADAASLIKDIVKNPPKPKAKDKKSAKKTTDVPVDPPLVSDQSQDEAPPEDDQPTDERVKKLKSLLQVQTISVDVALFGRMRANSPGINVDAAVAVSHPLTTNEIRIDTDNWTSVDDLSGEAEDRGAGGMGVTEFGSGVFYTCAQVNFGILCKNLNGDTKLAGEVVESLINAASTTTPSGMKNSFGNNVRAAFLRVEVGESSGNMFLPAFEKPVIGTPASIASLQDAVSREVSGYGLDAKVYEMDVTARRGSLKDVLAGVSGALNA